jgi:hypothetical protein
MMDFVDVGVKFGVVQQSVSPIEEKVFTEHKEQDLADDFLQVRETFKIKSHLEASFDFSKCQQGNDDQVAQSEIFKRLFQDTLPDFWRTLPWPRFIQNSISLKEWKLHHVNCVHAQIAKQVHATVKANGDCEEHDGWGHILQEERPDVLD